MADYELFYWSVPFRGQFVRAVLAYAGRSWIEGGDAAIATLIDSPMRDMPVPFMGPPVLVDRAAGVAIAQMPAILLYLGETLDLLPPSAASRALTMKVVNDANDVIDDLTLDGGRLMWTESRWSHFVPRLEKWMALWEETGRRHGLKARSGFLLGGETLGIADLVTAALWGTMIERFPALGPLVDEAAPMTAALSRRVAALPRLAALAAKAREDYGETYCGGQIEASLRKILVGRERGPKPRRPAEAEVSTAQAPTTAATHDRLFRVRDRHADPHRAHLFVEPSFESAALAYAEHLPFADGQREMNILVHDVQTGREHSYAIHLNGDEPADLP